MQALRIIPKIFLFDTFKEFNDHFKIGKNDLLVTNRQLYAAFAEPLNIDTNVIYRSDYGAGEPSDEIVDAMIRDTKKFDFDRVIAFGGGSTIDVCKLLALDIQGKTLDLFTGKAVPKKVRQLIAVPTTCGTGSEVTNVTIAELKELKIKKGLASDETFADAAVLIPETVKDVPFEFFVNSSVDALIHAVESFLSPKASPFTDMYSLNAIYMIMSGFKEIISKGEEERYKYLEDFLLASCYAGISLGNAGCAAVHALSYSIGGAFHVTHGESNYLFFTEVLKTYAKKNPAGKIKEAAKLFADILECGESCDVYEELEVFLNKLIIKRPLREYGMTESQIDEFTESTVENQQRLLGNNYVFLEKDEIRKIFADLF